MRILLISSFFGQSAGGLAIACRRFADCLITHGHDVHLVRSPDPAGVESSTAAQHQVPLLPHLTVVRLDAELVPGGYRSDLVAHLGFGAGARQLVNHCRAEPVQLCIAFGAGFNGLFAAHVAQRLEVPLIISLRGSEINLSLSDMALRVANRECLRSAAAIVGLSEELVRHAREIQREAGCQWFVIPNAHELPRLCDQRPLQQGPSSIIQLGIASHYLNEKKGIGVALRTMGFLVRRYPRFCWHLALVGRVDEDLKRNYEALALREGVADRISFQGLMSRECWLDQARSWDASLQMSPFEGFSNSTVESLGAGTPVLLSSTGYIAEQLRSVVPSLLLPDGPGEAIADRIHSMLMEENLADLSNKAIAYLRPLLAEDSVWAKWQNVFASVLGQKTARQLTTPPLTTVMLLHDVSKQEYSSVALPVDQLKTIVERISGLGLRLCSAAQFFESSDRSGLIICTFDDAYEGVYRYAYPVLSDYGFAATVFVPTAYIGTDNRWNPKDTVTRKHMDWTQLGELYQGGWEIGSHGTQHMSFLRLSAAEIDDSLAQSKETLSRSFGEVRSFAYPYGHHNDFVVEHVRQYYSCAFATESGGNHSLVDRYHLRRYLPSEIFTVLEGHT